MTNREAALVEKIFNHYQSKWSKGVQTSTPGTNDRVDFEQKLLHLNDNNLNSLEEAHDYLWEMERCDGLRVLLELLTV